MNQETKEAIIEAAVMGTEAFKAGIISTPHMNGKLDKFYSDKKVDIIPVLKAYTQSWHAANLAA